MADATRGQPDVPLPLPAYNSVGQLRADAWNSLKDATGRLADAAARGAGKGALARQVNDLLALLDPIEHYWAFPGRRRFLELRELRSRDAYDQLHKLTARITRVLAGDVHPRGPGALSAGGDRGSGEDADTAPGRPRFEVLVVDAMAPDEEEALREELRQLRRPEDHFGYELVVVPSFQDALVAVLFNVNLQACVLRHGFEVISRHDLSPLRHFFAGITSDDVDRLPVSERIMLLGERIAGLRPELDLYLVTQVSVEEIAGQLSGRFRRVFHQEDALELHLSILRGVQARYQTPFFGALRDYSRQPTGVFHALPVSRGKSVVSSRWIQDMREFYGLNMFLAETSATAGGLDSLLEPVGPIKQAQELAARAFGAHQTFFVTNGTSTANKIVLQSIVAPGDIVLVDRNCHKSHHYGLVQAGAHVAYLDAYPLSEYGMYGAVPLENIKRTLLAYRRAGRLDQVKLLMLTNCTFDGMVYDVERVMEQCLAIKPDLVFLWDEAWFAFAGFHPTYRRRTAMATARRLFERYRDPSYRQQFAAAKAELEELARDGEGALPATRLLPDPRKVRIRVYATQSTHKTLTALRQGSMIHIFDQDFNYRNEEAFHEAYMAHTSTSPNYQILASLDLGRRQVELEGFGLVQKQVELAMILYDEIDRHPLVRKWFRFLTTEDLIPSRYRTSGIELPLKGGLGRMDRAWQQDEFVLDPSRLALYIGATGIDGDTFKHEYLMDRYGIQVNKTSRNTVLFMTNIGTTRSSVAYLIEVLVKLARELEDSVERMGPVQRRAHDRRVALLTKQPPPLPDFSAFHHRFRPDPGSATPEGDLRQAFFLAYHEPACEYLTHDEVREHVLTGQDVVSAMFVTPYPPGFPVLVPGQVISADVIEFMQALDTREVHGYRPEAGYRVFTQAALDTGQASPAEGSAAGPPPR
jgi:arginine decarboxylase